MSNLDNGFPKKAENNPYTKERIEKNQWEDGVERYQFYEQNLELAQERYSKLLKEKEKAENAITEIVKKTDFDIKEFEKAINEWSDVKSDLGGADRKLLVAKSALARIMERDMEDAEKMNNNIEKKKELKEAIRSAVNDSDFKKVELLAWDLVELEESMS